MLGQQALLFSRQAGFATGEVQSLSLIAHAFSLMGNYPKALGLSLKAVTKAEAAGDELSLVWILGNIGSIYTYQAGR